MKRASANPCARKYYGCVHMIRQEVASDPLVKSREMLDMLPASAVKRAFGSGPANVHSAYENKIRAPPSLIAAF